MLCGFRARCFKENCKIKKEYIDEVFEFLDKNFDDWYDNIYFEKFKKNKKKYTSKIYWKLRIVFTKRIVRKIKEYLMCLAKSIRL